MKPSGSSSSGPETKKYLSQPRERQATIAEKKEARKTLQEREATRSTKPDYMQKTAKMTALKRELASRKAQANKAEARKPGESAAAHKKRVAESRYGNPNE
jgi:hypothetical protein